MSCNVAIVALAAGLLLAVLATSLARVRVADQVEPFQGAPPVKRRPPANAALIAGS